MRHNLLGSFFIAATLLSLRGQSAQAQINLQQQPGFEEGRSSGETVNQSRISNSNSSDGALKMVPQDFSKLKLAPGFLIGLNVLDDTDFTGQFRVDEQGDITVPVLGAVHVAGETATEARTAIRAKLQGEQILKDPQVSLSVLEYAAPQVTIIGEVAAPGKYPLLVPHSIVDVLAMAGGPTMFAGDEVQIIPAEGEGKPILVHYSKASNPKAFEDVLIHPGDTVQVRRAGVVYILGAVNRPGGYVMQEDGTLNLLQAISLANGTSVAASTKTIYLLRRNSDGTEVDIALPYKQISRGKRTDVQLRATDVLFIPTSAMKSILTNSQSVLASAASASIYAGILY